MSGASRIRGRAAAVARAFVAAAVVAAPVALAGCASPHDRAQAFMLPFRQGRYDFAASQAELVARDAPAQDAVLFALEQGAVARAANRLKESDASLERAYARIQQLGDLGQASVSGEIAAAVVNPGILNYRGTAYDRTMLATYKALNAMQAGDMAGARVELKRAQFFQQDAADHYAERIAKAQAAFDKAAQSRAKQEGAGDYSSAKSQDDPATKTALGTRYDQMRAQFRPYAEWQVPWADLVDGLWRITNAADGSDWTSARDSLRRVIGMSGRNAFLDADIADAEANRTPDQVVYVLVEAGIGPELEEFRLNIPAFIPGMPFVGVAFPVLKQMPGCPDGLAVQAGGARTELAEVCDFGRVVAKDFDTQLPGIIARCIASTLTKAAITCAINQTAKNSGNNWAQVISLIGTSAYGIATNRADQRIWESLPGRGLYARIPLPADRRLAIEGLSGPPIQLCEGSVVAVWARAPQAGSPPAVSVFRLR